MSLDTLVTTLTVVAVLQLLIMLNFMVHVWRLHVIQDSTSKTVLLLTVLANRQGATQADIEAALGGRK